MSNKFAKLLLIIIVPVFAVIILYQIDPKLIDPSSPKSIFSFLSSVNKASEASEAELIQSGSPSQLLDIIRRSFILADSLNASTGERDPMKPLIAVDAAPSPRGPRIEQPQVQAKFPLKDSDIRGIFWISGVGQVQILDRRYRVGENVKGAVVTDIGRNSVTFQFQNKSYIIEVGKPKTLN
jgi:hypothetical protein